MLFFCHVDPALASRERACLYVLLVGALRGPGPLNIHINDMCTSRQSQISHNSVLPLVFGAEAK